MIHRLATAALAVLLIAAPAQAQTVVIVRHGEKVAPNGDPDLSAAGQARAQALAHALADARVSVVLATPLKRTQQTAGPAAKAVGVPVVAVSFDGGDAAHVARVAAQARQAPAGATVLIVGHSNTIGDIARALGDTAPPPVTDCEYDQMTVLQLDGAGARAVHSRYGVPTESC